MVNDLSINFAQLEDFICAETSVPESSVHGLDHWRQVEFNGLLLSQKTHADERVVRLFALFHDSCRTSDGYDEEHGSLGANFAERLRGKLFEIDSPRFEKLLHACRYHTKESKSGDLTIDTCYDADRLDLGRVGILPDPKRMATKFGKEIAAKMQKVGAAEHREWIRHFMATA